MHPALWAWLDLADQDARFSDNFVHLRPGEPARIEVELTKEISPEQFRRALKARSLFDTYRAR